MHCHLGLSEISHWRPSSHSCPHRYSDQDYWHGRIWAPMVQLTMWGLEQYESAVVRGAAAGLVAQSRDLLMRNWRGYDGSNSPEEGFGGNGRYVFENYGADTGEGDSYSSSAVPMYSWGALLGMVGLKANGFYEPVADAAAAHVTAAHGMPQQWQQSAATSSQQGSPAVTDNRQLVWLPQSAGDTEAAGCLDGSPFGFYIWPGNSSEWSVFINGGGWCLTEELCEARTATGLGSSLGYNLSGAWGPTPRNAAGGPPAYTCQGLDPNCTRVFLPYCDGSCFTSQRAAPWPVNGSKSRLHFRGLANLDRTLDVLEERFGLAKARRLVLQGGSAGGLSTYLHLDRVTERLKLAKRRRARRDRASNATRGVGAAQQLTTGSEAAARVPPSVGAVADADAAPEVLVVGRPVAGFFIDEKKFDPSAPTYAENIKYGVSMFNSTPPLSSACKAKYPGEEWRCWMATYASPFVRERIFAGQSRFDQFQLMCLLGLPCFSVPKHQAYAPPYLNTNCSAAEKAAITQFGSELLQQMQPFLAANPRNGMWLVSCIQHNVVCPMFNTTEEQAFASWLEGGALGRERNYRWADDCGADGDGATPCDTGKFCAPPHF